MVPRFPRRLLWLLWIAAVVLWIAVALFPLSSLLTRTLGSALFVVGWFGLIGLLWTRRPLRFGLLTITLAIGGFILLPIEREPNPETLRTRYLTALQRFTGVGYFWGGESSKGIDCSGLIRRGWMEALFVEGWATLNPSLIRRALDVWWHDSTAEALGQEYRSWTVFHFNALKLNDLEPAAALPGDLAVTSNGLHIMAYLGERRWIEADPGLGKVVIVTTPSPDNIWFQGPMKILRWRMLEQ